MLIPGLDCLRRSAGCSIVSVAHYHSHVGQPPGRRLLPRAHRGGRLRPARRRRRGRPVALAGAQPHPVRGEHAAGRGELLVRIAKT